MANRVHAPTFPLPAPRRGLDDVWLLGVGVAALLVGILAGVRPELAITATLAAVLAPVVFAQPVVGLFMLMLLSFLEGYAALSGGSEPREAGSEGSSGLTPTKMLGLLLIFAWLAKAATDRRAGRAEPGFLARQPVLAAALVLFTSWAAVSMSWAEQPGAARESAMRFALNFVLFPVVLMAVRAARHVTWLFFAYIVGAIASAILGMLFGTALDPSEDGRLKGLGLNPNQLGELLIVATVFAVILASNRRWAPSARMTASAAAVVSAIFLCMTLSRGALIGLAVALLAAPFAIGPGRRAAAVVLVAATLVGTIGWFAVIAPAHSLDRVTHPERSGGSGRQDLWRLGWRMVEDHPVRGVGAANFRVSSIHYHLRPGRTNDDDLIVDHPRVVHNVYLNVLSELGSVGLALFAVVLTACLACALRAAQTFARQGDAWMDLLSRGLFIALLGHLCSLFFSSQLYSKQLWLLLALAPALFAIAKRSETKARPPAAALSGPRIVPARAGG